MDTPLRKVLAENVKALRNQHGWSQTDLEGRSGIKQTTISALERELHGATVDTIAGLAAAFRTPPWALLMPGLPPEAKTGNVRKVIDAYVHLPDCGRQELDRVAEAELRYHQRHP